jgi:hypothetical protein
VGSKENALELEAWSISLQDAFKPGHDSFFSVGPGMLLHAADNNVYVIIIFI